MLHRSLWRRRTGRGSYLLLASILATTLIALVAPAAASANDSTIAGWFWLNPLPTGYDRYADVSMVGDEAWAATDGPSLLHSTDAGRTYTRLALADTTLKLDMLDFVSASTGWAADSSSVYRSSDGGVTWSLVLSGYIQKITDLFALDATHAWVQMWDGTCHRTTNGGQSWQSATTPIPFLDVVFTDANDGWAVGYFTQGGDATTSAGLVYHTSDGGVTWDLEEAFSGARLYTVSVVGSHVWAGGAWVPPFASSEEPSLTPLVALTTGGSWRTVDPAPYVATTGAVVSIAFSDYLNGWAGISTAEEATSMVIRTADGGDGWAKAADLMAGRLDCNADGQMVGTGTAIVRYGRLERGDRQLLLQGSKAVLPVIDRDPSPLPNDYVISDLHFIDEQHGWAVDDSSGVIARTTNGGASWKTSQAPTHGTAPRLRAVSAATFTTVLAVGWSGDMFRSVDGGATWQWVDSGTSAVLTDVAFTNPLRGFGDSLHGWAVGGTSLLRTTDAGVTWNPVYPQGDHYWNAVALPSEDVVALAGYDNEGQRACIVRRATGTGTWDQVLTAPDGTTLEDVTFADSLSGWASGLGALYRTSDGGATWQPIDVSHLFRAGEQPIVRFTRVAFSDTLHGTVLATDGSNNSAVLTTTDGGETWNKTDFFPRDLVSLASFGGRTWVGGWEGTLLCDDNIDADAPVTMVDTTYDGRWTNAPVILDFPAEDPGVGLAYTRTRIGDAPWRYQGSSYVPAPANQSNDGAWSVVYQSVDKLGQAEAPMTKVVKIDTLAPADPNAVVWPEPVNGYVGPNPTFRWTSADWASITMSRPDTSISRVDVVRDRAYVIDGTMLRILDLTNPSDPRELGRVDPRLGLADLCVVGHYAYLVAQEFGMLVVDVTDPTAPTVVGSKVLGGISSRIAVTNHAAFVANSQGVAVVDIEKPNVPEQVGLLELRSVTDVAADGDLLLVAAGGSIVSFDVAVPATAAEIGSVDFAFWPVAVDLHGDLACVAWGGSADLVNVPNTGPPNVVRHLTVTGPFTDVVFTGTMLTLLAPSKGAAQVDVSEVEQPINVGWTLQIGSMLSGVDATPDFVYLAENAAGLAIARQMPTEAASYVFDSSPTTMVDDEPESGVGSVSYTKTTGSYFHVRTRDQAGNWSGTTHLPVSMDATSPALVVDGDDGLWHRSITLNASATDTQSGLASIQMAVDGGAPQTTSTLFLRTWKRGGGSGPHWVDVVALDRVGNGSSAGFTVYLDGRPPVTTDDAPKNPADRWTPPPQAAPVTVTLTATDAHSGVGRTWYSLDGADWTEGTSVTVLAPASGENDGLHWIGYFSEDRARNVEYSHWVPVVIDVPAGSSAKAASRGLRR